MHQDTVVRFRKKDEVVDVHADYLLIHTGKSMSNFAPPISWCDFPEADEPPRVRA